MGCDYYADENGEFEIEFRDYKTSNIIGIIHISNLKPHQAISRDILKGSVR